MEEEIKRHLHPKSGVIWVEGQLLEPGDTIEEGDVYSSQSGYWEESPDTKGLVITKDTRSKWIRPVKTLVTLG